MNRKRMALILLLLLAVSFLTGCARKDSTVKDVQPAKEPSPAAVYQKITAAEAYGMMEGSDDYILLDVRTLEEFEPAHIKGAMLLPVTEIQDKASEQLGDKDAIILVYCRSGNRSAQAAKQLLDMGYTRVYDFGGIIDWPYETVSGGAKED